jgi:alpha-beta hydrolase superfamily lysophospholipase
VLVEPGNQSYAAVLVIHGAGDHKTHFTWPLLHGLADTHFAACAIDVDGHGDNQRTLDYPSVLDNVSVAVAWLRERYQFVAVVGISQGGCITARAVAEGVEVDAVVLMETPTMLNVTRAVVRSEARILAHPAAWALHREVGTLALARSWKTAPTRTRLSTVELIKRLDAAGSVGSIAAPLLLVYGGSDAVVPPQQAHQMAHQAPPETTLLMVPRATHLSLSIDRRVVRQIAVWLQNAASKHARQ